MPVVDPLTGHTGPNQRCTCGWRRFREVRSSSIVTAQRYVFYEGTEPEGFGSAPFGTYFGAGDSGGLWGLFNGQLQTCSITVRCENCTRVRSQRTLSSSTIFGGYQIGPSFFVVAADITDAGCFQVEFRQGNIVLSASPTITGVIPAPLETTDTPIGTPSETLPAGAAAATTLLHVKIPAAPVEGDYDVVLVNRCCGSEQVLGTLTLEVDVLILNPGDADLNGAPDIWLQQPWEVNPPTAQPYTGAARGIPLDKCDGVIEYDARFGVVPDDVEFGFTVSGTGLASAYSLGPGGVLQINTPGGGATTIWEKSIALANPVDAVYSYAHYRMSASPGAAPGEGFNVQGDYSVVGDNDYRGTRWAWQGSTLRATDLDAATDAPWPGSLGYQELHWQRTAMAAYPTASRLFTWHNNDFANSLSVGDEAGAAPLADELRAQFGDYLGTGVVGQLRNLVVSAPRRFIRAWFRGYSTVTNPVVRLYVTSDLDGSGETLARFLIRYGGNTPYAIPTTEVSQSFNFSSRNTVFEVPIQLTGLTANAPFYFTVEREWDHADDRTRATVWLTQTTVRGA